MAAMAAKTATRIVDELAGKHVFVTGGSGFMGKVLVEKLLRSCPQLACIYLLMRPKKGVPVNDRLNAIINTPLFEPLLQQQPEAVSKLRVVAGDCSELGLGLSPEDEALLVDKVSYVFHAAATVRFDDPLKAAILLNTRGTREVVELCKKMKQLKVLEYVSTTYCFTNEPVLKEKPYRAEQDWRTMIRLAETEDKATLDALSHKILGFQPNTYTFSKALAESIINDARDHLPVVIFRPAVVINSLVEPFPGWLDNLNGPFGIWVGAIKGVLRFSYGDPDVALSFTPVDWAIRGMILVAVQKALRSPALHTKPEEVDVVNMEGSKYERNTYGDQRDDLQTKYMIHAVNPIRYPRYGIYRCYVYYWLGFMLSQLPYGLSIDVLLSLSGQKPRMIAIYRKIFHANEALAYFMLNEFPIETSKVDELHNALHPDDKAVFGTDIRDESSGLSFVAEDYCNKCIIGAVKYVLREEAPYEQRVRRLKILHVWELFLNAIWTYGLYLTVGRFVISRLPLVTWI